LFVVHHLELTKIERNDIKKMIKLPTVWDPITKILIEKKMVQNVDDINYILQQNYMYATGIGLRHRSKKLQIMNHPISLGVPTRKIFEEQRRHIISDFPNNYLSDEQIIDIWKSVTVHRFRGIGNNHLCFITNETKE